MMIKSKKLRLPLMRELSALLTEGETISKNSLITPFLQNYPDLCAIRRHLP